MSVMPSLLPASIVDDLSLAAAFTMWCAILWWMWRRGWRVQRRYFIRASRTPLARNSVVWPSAIIGLVTIVLALQMPNASGVVAVAMIGLISAITDWRTHHLPNAYTAMMALGVLLGSGVAIWLSPDRCTTAQGIAVGALAWFVPLFLFSKLPGGIGFGDVKLAPVLGAMLGAQGSGTALAGLVVAFFAAGVGALWRLLVGEADLKSRMPFGPWLILGALISEFIWGALPDWVGAL